MNISKGEIETESTRPAILFLAFLLPYPLNSGGQIKSYHTLQALASIYDITLLSLIRRPTEESHIPPLLPLCTGGVKVALLPRSRIFQVNAAIRSLRNGTPFLMERDNLPLMHHLVQDALSEKTYAAIHVDHLTMMQFVPKSLPELHWEEENDTGKRGDSPRIVLDQHNVEHEIIRQIGKLPTVSLPMRLLAEWEWGRLRHFERKMCRRADSILAVSEADASKIVDLEESFRDKITVVPIGVDTEYFAPAKQTENSDTLVSIGTLYWLPNVDGLLWFCKEVLPRIRALAPNISFTMIGKQPTHSVLRLATKIPNVTIIADADDVRPYVEDCAVFVVPLRSGSGMRVKILNALAMGLAIVTTKIGAEGIAAEDNRDLVIAPNDAAGFAAAVVRVLTDPALAARLRENGRRLAVDRYRWEIVQKQLLGFYDYPSPGYPQGAPPRIGEGEEDPTIQPSNRIGEREADYSAHLSYPQNEGAADFPVVAERRGKRILFITPYLPSRIRVRSYELIRHLAAVGHQITLVALEDGTAKDTPLRKAAEEELNTICHAVHIIPHPKWRAWLNCFVALPTPTTLWAAYCHSPEMMSFLRELVRKNAFDVAHIEHLRAAHFAESLGNLPCVFDAVDCITALRQQMMRFGGLSNRLISGEEWLKLRNYEPKMCHRFARIAVTTNFDKEALCHLSAEMPPIWVIPNGVDTDYFSPAALERTSPPTVPPNHLVFSGKMSYLPNALAADFLVGEVLPRLRALHPDTTVSIVGSAPGKAVRDLGKIKGVMVPGQVEDIRPYLAAATLAVCPMHIGVGIQNKAFEAMAMGLPVVATPLVARAFPAAVATGALFPAETAIEFTEICARFFADPNEVQKAGLAARRFAETQNWFAAADSFAELYESVVQGDIS